MLKVLLMLACLLLPVAVQSALAESAGWMTVDFLDVGKADAILVTTENSAVLIDTATNKMGDEVLDHIRSRGIEKLDLLIITHYDKDHVGGADKVIEGMSVERVLDANYPKDDKQFNQYVEALSEAGIARETLSENIAFELDGVRYEIDVANRSDYGKDEENDFSLIVRATHGENVFLFAGDAENARLGELIDEGNLAAKVLKVPHHGRYEWLSAAFFEAVGADWAIITSDEEEPEDAETVRVLEAAGAKVLLTREGTVTLRSDGTAIEFVEE